jgi:hypothetical protein
MPKGPRGERRPADSIGAAIMVAKIPEVISYGATASSC